MPAPVTGCPARSVRQSVLQTATRSQQTDILKSLLQALTSELSSTLPLGLPHALSIHTSLVHLCAETLPQSNMQTANVTVSRRLEEQAKASTHAGHKACSTLTSAGAICAHLLRIQLWEVILKGLQCVAQAFPIHDLHPASALHLQAIRTHSQTSLERRPFSCPVLGLHELHHP